MRLIAKTNQQTKAAPKAIFKLWADVNRWADYDQGIEWAKLTDNFQTGGHYTIKPKGGPKVKAIILIVEPNNRFVDESHLLGARLRFDHSLSVKNGVTTVSITMTISGPLSWFWTKILGKNQLTDLEQSTANLIHKAEKS